MNPVSPVIPDKELKEIIVAEHQPEYGNLPAIKLADGSLLSRWELSAEEKAFVVMNGYLYVRIWNFGRSLNPLRIDADEPNPAELPKRNGKYDHKEAFCLMKYQSKDKTEEEILWNSRDGVTSFGIRSRSGKEMLHVNWNEDRCVPNHVPKVGDRIFVDLTRERAEEFARQRVEKYWDGPSYPIKDAGYGTKEEAANIIADSFMERTGSPDVIEVTEEWLSTNRPRAIAENTTRFA